VAGRVFADRMIWKSPLGKKVEFVLIPQQDRAGALPSFYIMKNKVTNELFREYASDQRTQLRPETHWELGARKGTADLPAEEHPDFPVFRVHIADAEGFARWMAGQRGYLPSAPQWDQAAGQGDWPFDGPFNVPREELTKEIVAFNRRMEGPLPAGTASADISRYGCRDMAGNGMEWTRTIFLRETVASVSELNGQEVALRGGSYFQGTEPYTFEQSHSQAQEPDSAKPDIGFRVVIEVPP
jgi:formylglycine-generating enzyme required for sulfatase activity